MTCREKLKIEHPELVNDQSFGGCCGCPQDYGYMPGLDDCCGCDGSEKRCTDCWDREIPPHASTICCETSCLDCIHKDICRYRDIFVKIVDELSSFYTENAYKKEYVLFKTSYSCKHYIKNGGLFDDLSEM